MNTKISEPRQTPISDVNKPCKHLLQYILYTITIPRKPQKFRVSKPTVHGTDRREHDLGKRIAATCLVEIAHNSVTSAAKQVGIPKNTLSCIRRKAVEHAKENDLPITDPSNYEDSFRSGRPAALSLDEGDQLCSHVVSTRESRDKTAEQHIHELGLNISVSTFTQIMYDRGYGRRLHGWKTKLDAPHKSKRLRFLHDYREFDWKRRIICTDEASIKTAEQKNKGQCWRLEGEKFDNDVIKEKGPSDAFTDGMMWGSFAWGKKGPNHFFFGKRLQRRKKPIKGYWTWKMQQTNLAIGLHSNLSK